MYSVDIAITPTGYLSLTVFFHPSLPSYLPPSLSISVLLVP